MMKSVATVALVLAIVVVIVVVDLLVFRATPWPRLVANVGLVLIAGALYFRFIAPL